MKRTALAALCFVCASALGACSLVLDADDLVFDDAGAAASGSSTASGACEVTCADLGVVCGKVTEPPCGPPIECAPCVLTAVHPDIANPGQEIILEGLLDPSGAEVTFPGGGKAQATPMSGGSQRWRVMVPSTATSGPLSVTSRETVAGAVPFRGVGFGTGFNPPTLEDEQMGTAFRRPRLPEPRVGAVVFATERFVYVIGGKDAAGTFLPGSVTAKINADGSLGAFTDGEGGLHTARWGSSSARAGSAIYVVGGTADTGLVTASVERIALGADGKPSVIVEDAPLLTARRSAAVAVVGDWLYVLGGEDSNANALASVERAAIGADGHLDAFQKFGDLPQPSSGAVAGVLEDSLILIGGRDGPVFAASPLVAALQADGSLGPFEASEATLAQPRAGAQALVLDDEIVVVGGETGSGETGSTERFVLEAGGVLPSVFTLGPALARPRSGHGVAIAGNYAYFIGGMSAAASGIDEIERSSLNLTGQVGPFTQLQTTKLKEPRSGHCAVAIGDSIYVIGGFDVSGAPISTIERASVNADGQLGDFAQYPMGLGATGLGGMECAVLGDKLYLLGGKSSGDPTQEIRVSILSPDGELGPFSTDTHTLTTTLENHGAVYTGGSLYVLGGDAMGSTRTTIDAVVVSNDGSLAALFAPLNNLSLPQSTGGFLRAVMGDHLFVFDGASDGTATKADQHTTLANGAIGNMFQTGTPTIHGHVDGAGFVTGRVLHLLGGNPSDLEEEFASVDATGLLGNWNLGQQTPKIRSTSVIVLGDAVYMIGGDENGTTVGTVRRARLQ